MGFDLSQKTAVDAIRRKYGDVRSSHTFNNLYVWRRAWQIDLYLESDMYAASIGSKKENRWYFPIGTDESKQRFIIEQMKQENFNLCYMSEADVKFLQENFPRQFIIERDRNHDEYVTSIIAHLQLKGSKYSRFRRAWRRFQEQGDYALMPVDSQNLADVKKVLKQWMLHHPDCTKWEKFEMNTIEHGIFEEEAPEDIKKYILYQNEEPISVWAGYPISDEICNDCVSKNNGVIRNAIYGMQHLVWESMQGKYKYFNLEDDLGDSGLRTMKEERLPVMMNEMWRAQML